MTTSPTTSSSSSSAAAIKKIVKEIEGSAGPFLCGRCGGELEEGRVIERTSYGDVLSRAIVPTLKLILPPDEGKVRSTEHSFLICQRCLTEFLKFMQQGKRKKRNDQ